MNKQVMAAFLAAAEYFNGDVFRIQHFTKVLQYATLIAEGEGLDDRALTTLQIAAVLHDIGIPNCEKKYGDCDGKHQEIEGVPVARDIMRNLNVDGDSAFQVLKMISRHHSYSKIGDDLLLQILIEADALVNAFEENLSRDAVLSFVKRFVKTQSGRKLFQVIYQV